MTSTLLGPLVVLGSIAGIMHLALHQPDQPATSGPQSGRSRARSAARAGGRDRGGGFGEQPPKLATAVPAASGYLWAGYELHEISPWERARSAVVLVFMLAVVGALLAAAVAGLSMAMAWLVRAAVA